MMVAMTPAGRLRAIVATGSLLAVAARATSAQPTGGGPVGIYSIRLCPETETCRDDSTSMAGRLVLLAAPLSRDSLPAHGFVDWWLAFLPRPANGCFIPTRTRPGLRTNAAIANPVSLHWWPGRTDSTRFSVSLSLSPDATYTMALSVQAGGELSGLGISAHSPPGADRFGPDGISGHHEGSPDPALCVAAVRSITPRRPRLSGGARAHTQQPERMRDHAAIAAVHRDAAEAIR
jgi:hypothetical protein